MPPTNAPSHVFCTVEDVDAVLSTVGEQESLDDDNTAVISVAETLYGTKCIYWATMRCNFFLSNRYCPDQLEQSWMVNNWAAILAAYRFRTRRGNPAPSSLKDLYDESIADMKLVHDGEYEVPMTPLREQGLPAWSNIRVDITQQLRKARVQRPISERSPTPYPQAKDWGSEFIVEP